MIFALQLVAIPLGTVIINGIGSIICFGCGCAKGCRNCEEEVYSDEEDRKDEEAFKFKPCINAHVRKNPEFEKAM
jgi:hypothetical protein